MSHYAIKCTVVKVSGSSDYYYVMTNRKSNRRLFAVKSVARGRGVVIMIENDNGSRKVVTKEAIPPGQSLKTKF